MANLHPSVNVALGNTFLTQVGNGAKIQIYTGGRPANASAAVTGTLLVEAIAASPFGPAPNATTGVVTATDIPAANPVAAGTAGYARVLRTDNSVFGDFTVSDQAGSGEIRLATTAVQLGVPVDFVSFVVTPVAPIGAVTQ